jgi:predicted phosphodiesterase
MTHIGGYPGKYSPAIRNILRSERPQLFITGHSHILKVMYDKEIGCLHVNPGAAGSQGWHAVRTLVKLTIDGSEIKDLEVVELS